MPARRRIYLVRHGDVAYFDEMGRPQRPDLVPLTELGRRQSAVLREILESTTIDRVVTSGLPRTVQTAEILAGARDLEIEVREDLQEIRPGNLADIPASQLEEAFVGALSGGLDRSSRFLAGERFGDFLDRVLPCFRSLRDDSDWGELLIVAHGAVNRAIIMEILGSGLEIYGRIEQDPAALNVLDVSDAGPGIVRLLNFTPYAVVKEGLTLTTMEKLFLDFRRRES